MPFKCFKIPTGYYLYDRVLHEVINIGKEDYDEFVQVDNTAIVNRYKKQGICLDIGEYNICHSSMFDVELQLKSIVQNIILQLTQNCNLRCSYCTYSEHYNNRKHSNKRMSFETAKSAIDFGMEHSADSEKLAIGFYGGEPLLEFELIKKIVEYVKEEYPQKKVLYNLTTNATLLSDEILSYFYKNKIQPLISLDGPEYIHDRERRFIDGSGSHDIVMRNLKNAKKNYPELYKSFATNSVLAPGSDYEDVIDFLDTNETIKDIFSLIGRVSPAGAKEKIVYDPKFEAFDYEMEMKTTLSMLGKLSRKYVPEIFLRREQNILGEYKNFSSRNRSNVEGHPGGPCMPGLKKTFIDVDGVLYPCEKGCESPEMSIGNVKDGYDMDRIHKFLNIAKVTEDDCKNCWAYHFCSLCVVLSSDGSLTRESRLKNCRGSKNGALATISDIRFLLDCGYKFDLNKIGV